MEDGGWRWSGSVFSIFHPRSSILVLIFRKPGVAAHAFDAAEDAADVVAEADVEHAVDLVEDDEADVAEVDDVAVEQVHDASGRADDDLGAVAQELHLRRN